MTDNWKEITDPEELFKVKREGWEVECRLRENAWTKWNGEWWNDTEKFRARPRQPKMKKVNYLCYADDFTLTWRKESVPMGATWTRQPKLDLEGEIPDEQ